MKKRLKQQDKTLIMFLFLNPFILPFLFLSSLLGQSRVFLVSGSLLEVGAPAGTAFFGFLDPGYRLLEPYICLNSSLTFVLSLNLLQFHLLELMLSPYLLLALEGLPLDAAPGVLGQSGKDDPGWCWLEQLQTILSLESWLGDPGILRSAGKDNYY